VRSRVAVVGAGIAGLTAAHDLASGGEVDVVVLEADPRFGGKLRTEPFADVLLDTAPDAFLARRPEALDLCRELGLDATLVSPAESAAYVWSRGRLRRVPAGVVLGVPTDFRALARSGILSPLGVARAALEPWLPGSPLRSDEPVGRLVRRRFGRETAARLVDPLLGGINAGDTDQLSADAVAPQIASAARRSRSLTRALRGVPPPEDPTAPVFLTLPGGLEGLVDALVRSVRGRGGELRSSEPVSAIERGADGRWRLSARSGPVEADGVVLAVPAYAAAPLLEPLAPDVAATLAAVAHSSVTLVTFAYPDSAVDRPLDASGLLVPRPEGLLMTACSWASSKWRHHARPGRFLLRVSAGRAGDDRAAVLDDDDVVDRLRRELALTMGVRGEPLAVRVHRWPRAFPQYAPGHLERMGQTLEELAAATPSLTLAGAVLGGVGIPACIGTGRRAAAVVEASIGR
jgi:protoporphyrinogen/coproporphyrinogen III oxidase